MLDDLFLELDHWFVRENEERSQGGIMLLPKTSIYILGQQALLAAKLQLSLAQTKDLDAVGDIPSTAVIKLNQLLGKYGWHLDPDSHLIWMPKETEYKLVYQGRYVEAHAAKPEYVFISKALKAPLKNQALITEYLSKEPSALFFKLAKAYKVNLEQFLE